MEKRWQSFDNTHTPIYINNIRIPICVHRIQTSMTLHNKHKDTLIHPSSLSLPYHSLFPPCHVSRSFPDSGKWQEEWPLQLYSSLQRLLDVILKVNCFCVSVGVFRKSPLSTLLFLQLKLKCTYSVPWSLTNPLLLSTCNFILKFLPLSFSTVCF